MAFRSASQTLRASGVGTALNGSAPAGVVAGDYLAAIVVQDGITADTITPPAGWTSRDTFGFLSGAPDGSHVEVYDKIATGSDSYAWTTSTTNDALLIVGAWSGRSGAAPRTFVTDIAPNTTGNATPVSVALTSGTAASGDDIAVFAMLDITVNTDTWGFSPPAGYTEQKDAQQGFATGTLATKDNVAAGALGTLTLTGTRSAGTGVAGWCGTVIAIAAAPQGYAPARNIAGPGKHPGPRLFGPFVQGRANAASGNLFTQSVDGALSFVGALQKQTNKQLAGALSFAGGLQKQTNKVLAGVLSFAGGLQKQTNKNLAGVLSFSGALAAQVVRLLSISGALSFAGALQKQTNKQLAGALSFAGALQKQTAKQLAGVLSFAGALARSLILQQLVSGVLSFAGGLATLFTPGGGAVARWFIKRRARRDLRNL